MLDLFDDASIYQTAAYGEVRWGNRNLSRLVLRRDGEIVAIAQLRIIRPTSLKFGMAYLRWGPLWQRRDTTLDPETPLRMARAIEHEYLRTRKLFVHVLPNAFAGSRRAEVFQSAFSDFSIPGPQTTDAYRTLLVDITPSLEELRRGLDAKWRNKLKQSERNRLTVISGNGSEDFRAFCEIYFQMRERKTFESTVSVDEMSRIQDALPEPQRMHVLICQDRGVSVAGIVVSAMGDSAIYLLGATNDAGLNSKGAYFLHWTMISRLKEHGIKTYDLGGIDPEGNPGVYYFKRGFSGIDSCQINPFAASKSAVSSGMVKAGIVARRTLRASLKPLYFARSLRHRAAIS